MSQKFIRESWVGRDWNPVSDTLLCGDSHYGTAMEAIDTQFTVNLIDRYLKDEISAPYLTKLACIVTGQKKGELDRRAFWNTTAICNYLPDFMDGPGLAPVREQWAAGAAAFRATTKKLRPARVIFLAKRLWSAVLENHPEMELATPMTFEWDDWEVATLNIDGMAIPATWIKHPTRANHAEWHQVVAKFVSEGTATHRASILGMQQNLE